MKQDREAIRILVADIGYTAAAQRTQIKRDTLYKWGQRYGWKEPVQHAQSKTVQSVQPPSDIHAQELEANGKATKLSLSRYAKRAAQDSETMSVRESPLVHKVAQIATLTHPEMFGADKAQTQFSLNVLNVGSFGIEINET